MQIKYQKTQNVKDAFAAVKTKISMDTLAKMNINAEIQCDENRPAIVAKGKGFNVTISFHSDYCHCEVELSLILKAFKGRIEDSLKKEIVAVI